MRYRVTHRTTYSYDEDVSDSLGIAHVTPRPLPWQRVDAAEIRLTPTPADLTQEADFYGNTVTYYQVREPHTVLEIEAVSEVDVTAPAYDTGGLAQPWESCRPIVSPELAGAWRAADVTVASPLVAQPEEAADYAAVSLTPGRPIGEACVDLMHRIHAEFAYDKTVTNVTSTVPEILEARGGVCQDFAHLMIAGLRSHGLAARYVSGYLATTPPPGKERVVGADASHAWLAVWAPARTSYEVAAGAAESYDVADGEWLALDPTNDQLADDRYVTVAWGRDYGDVPPVKGVIYTDAKTSTLAVSVDVAPIAASV